MNNTGLPRIVVSALLHASIAQLVEHRSRKAGVISSILVAGTMISQVAALCGYFYLGVATFWPHFGHKLSRPIFASVHGTGV